MSANGDLDFTPLHDRVLILPDEWPDTTDSGLHVIRSWTPDRSGTVQAIGEWRCPHCGKGKPPDFAIGDHVTYSYTGGLAVSLGGQRHVIMHIDDIAGVIQENNNG